MGRQRVSHNEIAAFAQDNVNLSKEKADEYRARARRLRQGLENYQVWPAPGDGNA
jgi:hypothetical protein